MTTSDGNDRVKAGGSVVYIRRFPFACPHIPVTPSRNTPVKAAQRAAQS